MSSDERMGVYSRWIRATGGEPLQANDSFAAIISAFKSCNFAKRSPRDEGGMTLANEWILKEDLHSEKELDAICCHVADFDSFTEYGFKLHAQGDHLDWSQVIHRFPYKEDDSRYGLNQLDIIINALENLRDEVESRLRGMNEDHEQGEPTCPHCRGGQG